MKQRVRLTESDLNTLIRKVIKEVAIKGKDGKTHSLHGNNAEDWGVMSRLRLDKYHDKNGKNGRHLYNGCRDMDNCIELDNNAHTNMRSRNNAKRLDAMNRRIDKKYKDIAGINENKLNNIIKRSLKNVLKEEKYGWWKDDRPYDEGDDAVFDTYEDSLYNNEMERRYRHKYGIGQNWPHYESDEYENGIWVDDEGRAWTVQMGDNYATCIDCDDYDEIDETISRTIRNYIR